MYSVVTQNGNDAQYLTRVLVDTEAELTNLDKSFSPGSTAYIIETGNEFMLNNQKQWFKYIKSTSGGGSSGSIAFTPMGTVASIDDLPATGNRAWDVYMVGPNADGSYDEYYWTSNNAWELMGKSIPNLDDVIKEQVLYSGNAKTGTVEEPADGTIVKSIYDRMATLELKRLDVHGQEDNFIDEISVLLNNQVISTFFSPAEIANAQKTFVAEELVSYFNELNIEPTSYDGVQWTAATYPISEMTENNGPYLVLITQVKDHEQVHIKNLHTIFTNTMSREIMTISDIRTIAENVETLTQDVEDIKETLDTLEESSTLEII